MKNIIVDMTTPIIDGAEVVFRSPVDCSQITGLILRYNGESKGFAFTDAHGNDVGKVDHLFAENVVVKVILDVAHAMAFVQNADTNAYLEQRIDGVDLTRLHDLTPEEQAMVRANIGVTTGGSGGTISAKIVDNMLEIELSGDLKSFIKDGVLIVA